MRGRALRISRNQLVVRALERELREGSGWSTGFFDRLVDRDPGLGASVDGPFRVVKAERRSRSSRSP